MTIYYLTVEREHFPYLLMSSSPQLAVFTNLFTNKKLQMFLLVYQKSE